MKLPTCTALAFALAGACAFDPVLAQPAAGPVQPVTVRAVANFDFDRTDIPLRDRSELLAEVGKMKGVSWQSVQAVGHTDSIGSVAYNRRLSERRAQAVKSYLVSQGLAAGMIRTEGRGPETPVASNETAAGRAKNRRTEVEFTGVRAAAP